MHHDHKEACRTCPTNTIIYGRSSWDSNAYSVKYAWYDSRGYICRGGEVPIEAMPQMLEVAIREGGLRLEP